MSKIRSRTSVLLLAGLFLGGLSHAQESANSSGGNATGSGGTVAYSVGQVAYTTHTGSTGSVAQGVQHAYEIYSVGIEETEMSISLTAFPNPTTEILTLNIDNWNSKNLSYQLFDLQGKLLNSGQITEKQTHINTAALSSGTYNMKIVNSKNDNIQTFKIIKN